MDGVNIILRCHIRMIWATRELDFIFETKFSTINIWKNIGDMLHYVYSWIDLPYDGLNCLGVCSIYINDEYVNLNLLKEHYSNIKCKKIEKSKQNNTEIIKRLGGILFSLDTTKSEEFLKALE